MTNPFDALNGTYKPQVKETKAETERMKARARETEKIAAKEREKRLLKDAGTWSHTGAPEPVLKSPAPRNKASQKWKEKK